MRRVPQKRRSKLQKQKLVCCIPTCFKNATWNIYTGHRDTDNTQACDEHVMDLIEDSTDKVILYRI